MKLNLALVVHLLRLFKPDSDKRFCSLGATIAGGNEIVHRVLARNLQHEIGDGHASGRAPDAYSNTKEIARSRFVDNGAKPVVARMAAAALHAHAAGWDIELIMNDDPLIGCNGILFQKLGNRPARQVHEALGLGQHHIFILALAKGELSLAYQGTASVLPVIDMRLFGQAVNHFKASVMTRMLVLLAWIAQTND